MESLAQETMKIHEIEKELLKTNNFDLSLSLMIPLEIKEKKEQKDVKQLLKSIFKK